MSRSLVTLALLFAFGCATSRPPGTSCVYAGIEHLPADSPECVPPAPPPPPPPPVFVGGGPPVPDSITTLRVHYATDRSRLPGNIVGYSRGRGRLEYGVLDVSIPPKHRPGNLESPSWMRLEFSFDPKKHVMLHQVRPLPEAAMFSSLAAAVKGVSARELFVFVHGFNVSFEEAARRTAQIAFDLNLRIVPVMYSWPSQASAAPWAYTADEASIEKTMPNLRSFLEQVAAKSGASRIHLIAHSMGSRGLMRALEQIAQTPRPVAFHNVILAAPDIDRDVFIEQIAPRLGRSARRVTLYASANDEALRASRKVHGAPRLGEAGASLTVLGGMETIDASQVDGDWLGHSYIAANKQILDDLFSATVLNKGAQDRNLRVASRRGRQYWILP